MTRRRASPATRHAAAKAWASMRRRSPSTSTHPLTLAIVGRQRGRNPRSTATEHSCDAANPCSRSTYSPPWALANAGPSKRKRNPSAVGVKCGPSLGGAACRGSSPMNRARRCAPEEDQQPTGAVRTGAVDPGREGDFGTRVVELRATRGRRCAVLGHAAADAWARDLTAAFRIAEYRTPACRKACPDGPGQRSGTPSSSCTASMRPRCSPGRQPRRCGRAFGRCAGTAARGCSDGGPGSARRTSSRCPPPRSATAGVARRSTA